MKKRKINTCNTHDPITLSGTVFLRKEDPQIEDLQTGDLCLWFSLDSDGRSALRGRHTNYGYSGYVKASIFDGKKRRSFRLWELIEDEKLRYEVQYKKDETAEKVLFALEELRGQKAIWTERTYVLPEIDEELALNVKRELATQVDSTGTTLRGRKRLFSEYFRQANAQAEALRLEKIPKPGELVDGYVSSFNEKDTTIQLRQGFKGHILNDSVFINHKISPNTAMRRGETIEVKVLTSDINYISVELVRSQATDILKMAPQSGEHAGAFVAGKVVLKKDYGLFIKIEDGPAYDRLGLVHLSMLPGKTRTEKVKYLDSAKIGMSVRAEVIKTKVKNERIDIALSMTTVSTMKS